jgi:co-chaperonin GroES (HSP10)
MKLLNDRVLIQPNARQEQTAGGIFLSATAHRKTEGVVIATGPAVKALKVGDYVRLFDNVGIPVDGCIVAKESTEVELILSEAEPLVLI